MHVVRKMIYTGNFFGRELQNTGIKLTKIELKKIEKVTNNIIMQSHRTTFVPGHIDRNDIFNKTKARFFCNTKRSQFKRQPLEQTRTSSL